MKKYDLILVSYADTQMNHNGYIYQATNWIYIGMTKSRTDKYVEGNRHSRHYDNESLEVQSIDTFISPQTKEIKKYKIELYPKGENKNYILGTFIESIIIKK